MSSMLRVIQQRCAFHKPLISKPIYSYALPQSELLGNGAITPLQVALRGRVFQVGQQRLRPIGYEGIQLVVQHVEHSACRSSRRLTAGTVGAVRANRRRVQFLLGEGEAARET